MGWQRIPWLGLAALVLGGGAGESCTQTFIPQRPVATGEALPRPEVELRLLDAQGQQTYPPQVAFSGTLQERSTLGCNLTRAGVCRYSLLFSVDSFEVQSQAGQAANPTRAELLFTMTWDDLPRLDTSKGFKVSYSLLRSDGGMPTLELGIFDPGGKLVWLVYSGDSAAQTEVEGLVFRKAAEARFYSDNQNGLSCRFKRTHHFTKVSLADEELGIWVPGETREVDLDGQKLRLHVLDNSSVRGGSCDELVQQEQAHLSFVLHF
jgi:hypothetical protein